MREYMQGRTFPCKYRIVYSVTIREDKSQKKAMFLHILSNEVYIKTEMRYYNQLK